MLDGGWQLLIPAALAYALGAHARAWPGLAGAVGLLAVLEAAFGVGQDGLVPIAFSVAGPYGAGRVVRDRRELVRALAARAGELEAEEAELARLSVVRERARIARELHDIVAHHLAVMVVQAGAGRMAAHEPEERAATRFAEIGCAGERALAELSRLVDVVAAPPGDLARRLREVVDQARAAGLRVHAVELPAGVALPPELEDAVHRVVQEGLTNALKHAPESAVRVRLAVRDGALEVDVRDSGSHGRGALAGTGAGLGLTGLRERVLAAGGRLEAAPADGAGWRLNARLPLGA